VLRTCSLEHLVIEYIHVGTSTTVVLNNNIGKKRFIEQRRLAKLPSINIKTKGGISKLIFFITIVEFYRHVCIIVVSHRLFAPYCRYSILSKRKMNIRKTCGPFDLGKFRVERMLIGDVYSPGFVAV